jgi:hypothetical protein
MGTDPSITDWITSVASVFAAVGTVGAVVVALWQVQRQGRRSLAVKCSRVVIGDVQTIHGLALRGSNDGSRPIKLTMAYLMSEDGRQVVSPFLPHGDRLPKALQDGESVDVFWDQGNLQQIEAREGVVFLYAFFLDILGNVYKAPYPGVITRRKGIRRRQVFEPPEKPSGRA